MKDFMPKFQQSKKLVENVLQIATKARIEKEKNQQVINATAGSYYNEDGNLKVFDVVKQHFQSPNYNKDLSYASIAGTNEFKQCVFDWVVGENNLSAYKNYYQDVIATPGGTGAISMAMATYLEKGDGILLPNLMWPAYVQIANDLSLDINYYNLYNENDEFDLESLEEQIILSQEKYGKVFIVINDPCHNPTGFMLSNKEYQKLVTLLNKHSNNFKIILLMDIAYLDYTNQIGEDTRTNFKELLNLSNNVKVLFAFSASKTFGFYGFRLGALVHITKDLNESNLFIDATNYHARSTWSNVNHLAMNIMEEALTNPNTKQTFKEELKATAANLTKRAEKLTKYLDLYNVPYAPYQSGFFVLLIIDSKIFDQKLEEHQIYGCRFGNNYRIALASINLEEAERLGQEIGQIYEEIKTLTI